MSCCPKAPPPITGIQSSEANGPESDMQPGESTECYMNRAGNTTGLYDDATEDAEDKIANTAIPISQSPVRFDSIQFKLTPNSKRTATSWTLTNDGGSDPSLLGVNLSPTGLWSGTISPNAYDKKFNIVVTASDAQGVIDSRGFSFSPGTVKSGEIKLISPLPGAIINSKYGLRVHPITKVRKAHEGIDMKYADRSVKDVVAAADGEVVQAGGNRASGYGLKVWVKHVVNGSHLCTTTYNHLNKIYVRVGQKVMAGQAIGLEGTTGSSTGNHLHFEVRLPNGTFVDPEPLINGSIQVATSTTPSGGAAATETKNSSASMTKADAEAKQAGCKAFGPDYPSAPQEAPTPPPVGSPFELAWFYTMTEEVGPFWNENFPNDPDVANGLIQTPVQRRKCGYVNTPNFPGGETKFGIAQKPNPQVKVRDINYEAAKSLGYSGYWTGAPIKCSAQGPYVGIMLFDMNYLHGGGNARVIWNAAISAGMNPTASGKSEQIKACEILTRERIKFIEKIKRPEFTRGWLNRANNTLLYVRNLPDLS